MPDPKYVADFVRQLTPYAVAVGDQYGIDPVTIITQAAVETGWGREVSGNNYFGVKSHGLPGGQNITTHEEVNGRRVKTTDNFRAYGSMAESVADYGRFLSENPRYTEALKQTGPGELQGIAAAGYATDSSYPSLVRNVASMVQRNIQPLPPGEIPTVASLTDTVPPRAVAPVTPSIDMAQMRRQTMPTNLVADSFAAIPGTGSTTNLGDQIAMNPIRGGKQIVPQMDAGFDPGADAMRMYVQSSASDLARRQGGGTQAPVALPRPRPQTAPPDLISQSMARVASANPARLPELPPSTLPNALAPMPATQSVDLRQSRLPLPSSSPMTRSVASVPVPPTQSLPPLSATASRPNIPQSYAGMDGYRPPTPIPGPAGSTVANKSQDRLGATPALPPALYGGVAPSAVPPAPYPTIARAPLPVPNARAVATQLATTPPRVAPVPFNRPNFGMGGVDINEPLTANGVAAPMPMPRLQRGGIFGKPQIMGHDVPLPGIFGMAQNATRTMNNASGPFNNGADNALYNIFRGGDFNTPGAATARSGGFLFAPNPNGGFTNVGRDPNFAPRDGSPGNGGLNTVSERYFGEARNHN